MELNYQDTIKLKYKNLVTRIIYGVYFLNENEWVLHSSYTDKSIAEYQAFRLNKQAFGQTMVIESELYIS